MYCEAYEIKTAADGEEACKIKKSLMGKPYVGDYCKEFFGD